MVAPFCPKKRSGTLYGHELRSVSVCEQLYRFVYAGWILLQGELDCHSSSFTLQLNLWGNTTFLWLVSYAPSIGVLWEFQMMWPAYDICLSWCWYKINFQWLQWLTIFLLPSIFSQQTSILVALTLEPAFWHIWSQAASAINSASMISCFLSMSLAILRMYTSRLRKNHPEFIAGSPRWAITSLDW